MQIVSDKFVSGKKVLLRLDIDVEIEGGKVAEDYRLRAGIPTIRLCLEVASEVIIMGHIGRPKGKVVPELSVEPVFNWFSENGFKEELESKKLRILENLRFEAGEDEASLDYAKELAALGDVYINEAFSSHHKAASTTVLPTLLPHAAGLRFAKEVDTLTKIRQAPKRPQVAIVGGAKVEDKYQAILDLSNFCDNVLVGGLLAKLMLEQALEKPSNVVLGALNEEGIDLSAAALGAFAHIIKDAKDIIWAGPVGKYEDENGNHGDKILAEAVTLSEARSLIGGGDTISALNKLGFLDKFTFVSVGGGAMLELLTKGTLPTIDVLE